MLYYNVRFSLKRRVLNEQGSEKTERRIKYVSATVYPFFRIILSNYVNSTFSPKVRKENVFIVIKSFRIILRELISTSSNYNSGNFIKRNNKIYK